MKRTVGAMASLLVVAVVAVAALRRGPAHDVPTFTVHAAAFNRHVTAEGNLKAVKATPLSAPTEAPSALKIAWIADDGTLLKKNDVVVRFDPTDFERDLTRGNEDHAMASNNLDRSSHQAGATRNNLRRDARQAEAELEMSRRFNFDDAEVFSRYQRVEAEVDQKLAGERKAHAERILGVRENLTQTERELLSIEDRKAALRIRNAQQGLSSLEIRAPYDGILVLQRDWRGDVPRVGSNVWQGMRLGEIPELQSMQAEVFVLEADAAGIAVGKAATIALESNPLIAYPGRITQIDKLARPRFRGVPVQYFGVTLSLDRTDTRVMKPGARVTATLQIENRARAFAVPRQALFEKEGKRLVYRKHGDRFDAVPVQIASSSAGRVVVTSGLAESDELALVDPNENNRNE